MITLPAKHHSGDTKWLKEQLLKLANSTTHHAAHIASIKYSAVYIEHLEINAHKVNEAEGLARREANTRLRKYIKALEKKYISRTN